VAVGGGRAVAPRDALRLVGATRPAPGPHRHVEVLKNGRQIDPLTFIGR
jgi:murein DD-endopeptidase MepM/ murein hydrolase activator NlpD